MSYAHTHFEIARLRYREDVHAAERRNRLFRRPFTVPPEAPTGATVINMPTRDEHTSPCATRVA